MSQKEKRIVIIPCSGASARGRLTYEIAEMIKQGLPEIEIVNIVPLMAKLEPELSIAQNADIIISIAGCDYRCELTACREVLEREPDETVLIGKAVREDVREYRELSESEKGEIIRKITSQILGKISSM